MPNKTVNDETLLVLEGEMHFSEVYDQSLSIDGLDVPNAVAGIFMTEEFDLEQTISGTPEGCYRLVLTRVDWPADRSTQTYVQQLEAHIRELTAQLREKTQED